MPYAELKPVGARRDQAWPSPCPSSARPGAVGQVGTPFQAGVFLSQGGPILASAQETCLYSHSMQACSNLSKLAAHYAVTSRWEQGSVHDEDLHMALLTNSTCLSSQLAPCTCCPAVLISCSCQVLHVC